MQYRAWLAVVVIIIASPCAALAMSSANYGINWDSVNSGGLDVSTSTNYTMRDTVGEQATGESQSANYRISAGYRVGEGSLSYMSLLVGAQENSIQTTWTAFSNAGRTVTVASSGIFAVGDYLGIIQNEGFAEKIAIGKISQINGSIITVDAWAGEPADISATPSGNGNIVYRLNNQTANLGTLYPGEEHEALSFSEIATNAQSGYTVTVQGLTPFQTSSSHAMTNVADGAISLQSEEYGAEDMGDYAYATGTDLAIPTASQRTIQSSATGGSQQRVGLLYKVSVTPVTQTGQYTQTVVYRLTANF